ncbi:MAG: hypothetical protein GY754_32940 [bacterium]|nr:hypothetical protein [bacterium]
MAKYDTVFKERLLEERESALNGSGVEFTSVEKMLLMNIDNEKLLRTIDEFTVPGISKKSLPNWRAAAAVIMLLSSVLIVGPLSTSACRSEQVQSGEVTVTDGWFNKDTFRWRGTGIPKQGITDITKRKETAKNAAVLNAQYIILEKFKGTRIEGAGSMITEEWDSMYREVGNEVKKIVKNGKVIKETYDKDQNCVVVYEVSSPKLKKKVLASIF